MLLEKKIKLWKKLYAEILDTSQNKGSTIKKEDTHKMAESNKAFAHLDGKILWLNTL